jgi:hypothetical protein
LTASTAIPELAVRRSRSSSPVLKATDAIEELRAGRAIKVEEQPG